MYKQTSCREDISPGCLFCLFKSSPYFINLLTQVDRPVSPSNYRIMDNTKLILSLTDLLQKTQYVSPCLKIWYENNTLKFFFTNNPAKNKGYNKRVYPPLQTEPPISNIIEDRHTSFDAEELSEIVQNSSSSHDFPGDLSVFNSMRKPNSTSPGQFPPAEDSGLHLDPDVEKSENKEEWSLSTDIVLTNRFSPIDPNSDTLGFGIDHIDSNLYHLDHSVSNGNMSSPTKTSLYSFCERSECSICKFHGITKPLKFACFPDDGCQSTHWHERTKNCQTHQVARIFTEFYATAASNQI